MGDFHLQIQFVIPKITNVLVNIQRCPDLGCLSYCMGLGMNLVWVVVGWLWGGCGVVVGGWLVVCSVSVEEWEYFCYQVFFQSPELH